jgi:colanic acid biosynthesis glycosyl transferase WcaI
MRQLIRDSRPVASHKSNSAPRTAKIVFVNRYYDPDQSATSQILTDLAKGLVADGFDVWVISSRQLYEDSAADLAARQCSDGVQVCRVATTRFGRGGLPGRALDYLSFYVSCAITLLRMLERGDILVVKTDPPLLSLLAAPIAAMKRIAFINWQQDVFPEVASLLGANPFPTWFNACLSWARDSSLRSAEMNVAIGTRMREYFAKRGIPESKLCVIENWADAEAIRPKPAARSTLRSRLGLINRFVICYSGNLGRAHEFETLLGAAKMLSADKCFVFLMIGGGAKMGELKHAVAAFGLNNFIFLPYQPRGSLEDSLAASDVHIVSLIPALEGFILPSKLYGILAAGRPVIFIGDPDGDTSRVIDRAHCGRKVEVGDSSALADVLHDLAARPEICARMGSNARQEFCENFGLARAISRWRQVIEAVRAREAS